MGPVLRLIALIALLVLAGCGGTTDVDRPNQEASLLLDFTPNGVHTGIYLALARDFDGMFTVAAAMMQARMVLSQPVSSTTPSSG